MRKVVNFYAGPGAGKSTMSTALFSSFKFDERNIEYVSEYAKDVTWEQRGPVVFRSQEYIFAQQFFRMERLVDKVDFMITDSPILLSLAYVSPNHYLPSLRNIIFEADSMYDTINIFVKRSKKYIEAGRSQTYEEACIKDNEIKQILNNAGREYYEFDFSKESVEDIKKIVIERGW